MTSLPSSKRPAERSGVQATRPVQGPVRALLASIVDYAGLFPPAGLELKDAVRAYDRHRAGEHAWMLGAFVVPAARLEELDAAVRDRPGGAGGSWPLSVLVRSSEEAAHVARGVRRPLRVRALEVAPQAPEDIIAWPRSEEARTFHEVPLDDRSEARLDAIAKAGTAAKVRTGGVEPNAFPTPERLAAFIGGCVERGVPFKATAGLHHPLRGQYPVTYEEGSARCAMFGFLEVALAAALLWHRRIPTHDAAELLREPRSRAESTLQAAVQATEDALLWSGHRLSLLEVARLRRDFFLSFGSCSFDEPVADLTRLGFL